MKMNSFERYQKRSKQNLLASNPLRYKTELCRSYMECGKCKYDQSCTFAHGSKELRAIPRHPRYKTQPCKSYHDYGTCNYGARCHFIHSNDNESLLNDYNFIALINFLQKMSM